MKITPNASLLPFNTFGVDVKADYLIEYDSVAELQDILKSEPVISNRILHIGSGSNLLFLNDFKGVILHSNIKTITIADKTKDSVFLEVGSGVVWDDFVSYCVENGLGGIENLALIPGEVGASAVQNIGAYGVEVQDVIQSVKTVQTATGIEREFSNTECGYGYRESIFKNSLKGKYILTSVIYELLRNPKYKLKYQHLEDEVLKTGKVNLKNIRSTIINIRESKLPDPKIAGNAGSFFMNPVVSKEKYLALQSEFPQMPHYYISETEEKIPAGWLIDQCGWKGKSIGNAGVHDKQALVLVNRGGATGTEIVYLAEQIQHSIKERFGIKLQPEVNYI